jgi:hypothetical protein
MLGVKLVLCVTLVTNVNDMFHGQGVAQGRPTESPTRCVEWSGEVLFVRKADKGKKDKWMRESRSRRSDLYADYKGSISRLGHSGNDRVLRRNFGACFQPLMAIEKVLTTVPMGGSARKDLVQARRVLADRLYLLEVERETNPTVAAFVEVKRSKGQEV